MKKEKAMKVRKSKEKEEYIFKKTNWLKISRALFWAILIFLFIRGIVTTFRPDQTAEVTQIIEQFRKDFSNYKDQDSEIMGFAQNFAKDYLTYENRDEAEYKERIRKYVSDNLYSMAGIMDFKGNAEAVYVQAYRKEEYSPAQYDVYVRAEVKYTIQSASADGSNIDTEIKTADIILKVPVFVDHSTYIIEDLPLFVNDDNKNKTYKSNEYIATEITDDAIKETIQESLNSFLKAYYEQDQNVINYYLTQDVDYSKFLGLNGRLTFESIDSLKCCQEEGSDNIICIVKIKVKDSINDVSMYQQFNVTVIKSGDKFYVKDIDTKTVNLNIK